MNREVCEHFNPVDLSCDKCKEQQPVQRTLTDEVIAELWHKNGGFHHHFARSIERWLRGGA